jgi:hypothetical protein
MSHTGLVAIIAQRGLMLAGLVESCAAVSFRSDVDKRGFLCVLGEKIYRTSAVAWLDERDAGHTLVPRELPSLQLRLV